MRSLFAALVTVAASGVFASVSAQTAIGEMAQIQGQVTGAFRGAVAALKNGSSIVQNQVVSTAENSSGRIAFHDLTSLALGPGASVTMDRYVYDAEGTMTGSSLNLTRGAFRLISGRSASGNIGVKTPTATIGLRGTIVDVLVRPGRELVVLQQGAMTVCKASQCVPVDRPGYGVVVDGSGVSAPSADVFAELNFDVLTSNRFDPFLPYGGSPGGDAPSGSSSSSQSYGSTNSGRW